MKEASCKRCGNTFETKHARHFYCSKPCQDAIRLMQKTIANKKAWEMKKRVAPVIRLACLDVDPWDYEKCVHEYGLHNCCPLDTYSAAVAG